MTRSIRIQRYESTYVQRMRARRFLAALAGKKDRARSRWAEVVEVQDFISNLNANQAKSAR